MTRKAINSSNTKTGGSHQGKRKHVYSIDELNAWQTAYGKPIQRHEMLSAMTKPFLIAGVFVFLLTYYWWAALIAGLLAAFYARRVLVPQSVRRYYENKAFIERNNFINNMTQCLTNKDTTMLEALSRVSSRAHGELKDDLILLQTDLQGTGNSEQISQAFQNFSSKYQSDVIFTQFVEQLITATIEGRTNIETLQDITSYHNRVQKTRIGFFKGKQKALHAMFIMSTLMLVVILAISFSFGWTRFFEAFSRSPIGWITSALWLLIMALFVHSFVKRMGDDEVLEVRV